jgi:hypothetical protein
MAGSSAARRAVVCSRHSGAGVAAELQGEGRRLGGEDSRAGAR